jgi:hypothetical protein
MEEIIKNVKTSTMLTETEHWVKEMIENIGKIRHLKIPVVHVFLWLLVFQLLSVPSSDPLVTCQGEC